MEPGARPSYIVIARIARTRGNRGEVLADLFTDFPSRFDVLEGVWLEFPDGQRRCYSLESCWQHKGRQVLKFCGIDAISSAESLVGAWVEVEAQDSVELPEGTYFDHDLIGCAVRDAEGKLLGHVQEVMRLAGNHQLVVKGLGREFMVPAVAAICTRVSIEGKEITVDLPEGLIDLNK